MLGAELDTENEAGGGQAEAKQGEGEDEVVERENLPRARLAPRAAVRVQQASEQLSPGLQVQPSLHPPAVLQEDWGLLTICSWRMCVSTAWRHTEPLDSTQPW